ncbi:MAG: cation:proton antiporter, partial [Candidatus Micrarchaeota archaeon]
MIEPIAQLGVVSMFALLGGVIATRFNKPSVLGLLVAGALIGPNALGLVHEAGLITILTEIGAVLLLFRIGLEFNVSKLLKIGPRAIVVGVLKISFVFIVTYEASLLLGLTIFESMILGATVSITSTAIVAKILAEKGMSRRPEYKLLIATLIIEDVFAIFMLTLVSSLRPSSEPYSPHMLLISFVIAIS